MPKFAWVGKTVALNCNPDAHPKSNFTWYKNGVKLEESDGTYIIDNEDGTSALEVRFGTNEKTFIVNVLHALIISTSNQPFILKSARSSFKHADQEIVYNVSFSWYCA